LLSLSVTDRLMSRRDMRGGEDLWGYGFRLHREAVCE
jgi:hypothetical protein